MPEVPTGPNLLLLVELGEMPRSVAYLAGALNLSPGKVRAHAALMSADGLVLFADNVLDGRAILTSSEAGDAALVRLTEGPFSGAGRAVGLTLLGHLLAELAAGVLYALLS